MIRTYYNALRGPEGTWGRVQLLRNYFEFTATLFSISTLYTMVLKKFLKNVSLVLTKFRKTKRP